MYWNKFFDWFWLAVGLIYVGLANWSDINTNIYGDKNCQTKTILPSLAFIGRYININISIIELCYKQVYIYIYAIVAIGGQKPK